jgi:hypothetical protein
MPPSRTLVRTVQAAAGAVLAVGLLLAALHGLGAAGQLRVEPVSTLSQRLHLFEPVALCLILALGLSALLLAAAALLQRPPGDQARTAHALDQLSDAIASLRADVEALADRAAPSEAVAPDVTPPPPAPDLQRIMASLDELREIALMDEAQRRRRAAELAENRKQAALQQLAPLIDTAQWTAAQEILAALEDQWEDDPDVAAARQTLADARQRAQEAAFGSLSTRVEDLMAISSWDEAIQLVEQFAADFPQYAPGRQLLARVNRERTAFREATVQRLYDDIRHDVERRHWRRALAATQRLLERVGDHPRARQIRGRLTVIQDNAEIEERQEQESRIQELIRARRYRDAIELAHRLISQFPDSPQGRELEDLLPKLRELRAKQDAESAS